MRRNPAMPSHCTGDKSRGLTLLELVVAMALFALVAVMGLQTLSGMIRSRDRLIEVEAQSRDLSVTLNLLRGDLDALVPLVFHPHDAQAQSSVFVSRDRGTVLHLSTANGVSGFADEASNGLGRVIWRFDVTTGQLTRQSILSMIPADDTATAPEIVMLTDVRAMNVRRFTQGESWNDAPDNPTQGYSNNLPEGIEVTIESEAYGAFRVMVAPG